MSLFVASAVSVRLCVVFVCVMFDVVLRSGATCVCIVVVVVVVLNVCRFEASECVLVCECCVCG